MPVAIAVAASAAFAFIVVAALVATARRRDPIGRAIAGHATLLEALHDSAIRANESRGGTTEYEHSRPGVNIIPSEIPNQAEKRVTSGPPAPT